MKLTIITAAALLCLSSCNFKTGEPLPIKFSLFSTEYGARASYSNVDGFEMGADVDAVVGAIDSNSGK